MSDLDGEACKINLDRSRSKYIGCDNISSKVKQILYVCDNAMISDTAYHELSMHVDALPRKGAFISCRGEIISQFEVKRNP